MPASKLGGAMGAHARFLPLAALAASWALLRAIHAASSVGVAFERAAARGLVVLAAAALLAAAVRIAWPRLRVALAHRAGRVAFALAALGYLLLHALLAGMLHVGPPGAAAGRVALGEAYGPLTVWPSATVEWPALGIVASVSAGRAILAGALALTFAACAVLAWQRSASPPRCVAQGSLPRGGGLAAAAWLPATLGSSACAGCLPPFLALLPAAAGALALPAAGAFSNPTSLLPTLVEASAPLLALASLLPFAGEPDTTVSARASATAPVAAVVPLAALPILAAAGLPAGASPTQQAIHGFFLVATAAALVLLVPVMALIAYYALRYREGADAPARGSPLTRRGKRAVLAAATLVPAVIIFGLGVLSYQVLLEMEAPPAGTYHVEVTGTQFEWRFTHPDGTMEDGVLRVPVDEVVVLNVTTEDVVHSFFVPDLGVRADALPGHTHQVWFRALRTGTFDAHCAEFCGRGHATMKAAVVVEAR